MYIHESLAEFIQCGDTSFPVSRAYNKVIELNEMNDAAKSGFGKQFEVSLHC